MKKKTIIVFSLSFLCILVGVKLILSDKKQMINNNIRNTTSPTSWTPLMYYFYKEIFKTNPNLPPNIDVDCVLTKIVLQYPNPTNANNLPPNALQNILLSCMSGTGITQSPTPTLSFSTTIPSSWNDQLTSNLKDMIPSNFSNISDVNINCLVKNLKELYPNPVDFIKFIIQLPLDNNNNNLSSLPDNIISKCKYNYYGNGNSKIGTIMIVLAVLVLIGYYIIFCLPNKRSLKEY